MIDFEDPKFTVDKIDSPHPDAAAGNDEDDCGPLSPVMKTPIPKIAEDRTPPPRPSPENVRNTSLSGSNPRRPAGQDEDLDLKASQQLNKRLFTMARAHAKMTANLLSLQKEKYEIEMAATRDDWDFEKMEAVQEVAMLRAENEAMQAGFDAELAGWSSRAAASEARVAQLQAERVEMAREMADMRQNARAKEREFGVMMAKSDRKRDEQLSQFGHLMMLSSSLSNCSAEDDFLN